MKPGYCELSADYIGLAEARLKDEAPMLVQP